MPDKSSGDNKLYQIIVVVITTIVSPLVVFFVTNGFKEAKNNTPTAPPPALTQAADVTLPPALTRVAGVTKVAVVAKAAAGTKTATPTQPAGVTKTATPVQAAGVTQTATPTLAASVTQTATLTPLAPSATPPGVSQPTAAAATPAPESILNPVGKIPGGTIALVENLSLTISAQDVKLDKSYARLTIHIRNLGSTPAALEYTPGAVTVKDAAGHAFEPFYGGKKSSCGEGDLDKVRTVQIEPGAELALESVTAADAAGWCNEEKNHSLPMFTRPARGDAKKLEIGIEGLGPFKGFAFEITL